MKILEAQSGQLTNYEVHKHLLKLTAPRKDGKKGPGNLNTVVRELAEYLEEAPSPLAVKPLPYNDETFSKIFSALREFKLTKTEILMIINLRPTNPEALAPVIEEFEERFNEEDGTQQKLIKLIIDVLGSPDTDAERQSMADSKDKALKNSQGAKVQELVDDDES
ncbi:DNA-directed RNA polymerase-like protein III subunit RPC9 [Bisporella sp. PMI_857]|nr:DNA-directed RNA polymerase-like protein III subunit RPC9 [Bisporella sp. PMI_857]